MNIKRDIDGYCTHYMTVSRSVCVHIVHGEYMGCYNNMILKKLSASKQFANEPFHDFAQNANVPKFNENASLIKYFPIQHLHSV